MEFQFANIGLHIFLACFAVAAVIGLLISR